MRSVIRRGSRRPRLTLEALETRLAPAIRVWSGGGPDANWSTAANWGGTGVPAGGDDLQFPATAFTTSNNDIVDLTLNSLSFTTGNGYTLTGVGFSLVSSITAGNPAGTNRININLSLVSSAFTIDVTASGILNIGGVLDGFPNVLKIGGGELVLGGNNLFIGGLTLSSGTLTVANNNALGTGSFDISGGTTLQADASPRTVANSFTLRGPAPITLAGPSALTLTGAGGLAALAVTLNVTSTATATLSGNLSLAFTTSSLIKTGPGTLALGGTNTYGPTTVNAGTLLVNGTQSGNSVAVNAGGTLGGTGNAGLITSTGGTVSPGVSPGILNSASATFDAASTFTVELNGTTPGTGHDQLLVSGPATLGGMLNATLGFVAATGDAFVILRTLSTLTGTFAGLPNGTIFVVSGRPFRINYTGGDVILTRVQGTTTTALVSSVAAPVFGQSVTLTATVSFAPPGAIPPTGTVTFRDGGTPIATVALNAAAQASFTTSTLAVGNHTLDAVYNGDPYFTGSTSAALPLAVARASTTTALAASTTSPVFGQPVTFTATVSAVAPGAGTPSGTVTFRDGGTPVGTGTLNAAGLATFTTSSLAVGNHTLDAVYASDNNFNASTSAALALIVNRIATVTALIASLPASVFGQAVTFTATVSFTPPGGTPPTGTVTFRDGGTILGTGTLNAAGQATFTTSALAAGSHSLDAVYGGDGTFNGSTSTPITLTVVRPNTATVLTSSANPIDLNVPLTLIATVRALPPGVGTPTGTVTFFTTGLEEPLALGTAALNNGVATLTLPGLTAGCHVFTARYGGDNNFQQSASGVLFQNVALTPNQAFVVGLYRDVLERAPDPSGFAFWVPQLDGGLLGRAQVATAFWESAEHRGLQVDLFYRELFGRAADPVGRATWLNALLTGLSEIELVTILVSSPEYTAAHLTAASFVNGLYDDLLGRAADAAGAATWTQILASGARDRAAIAYYFLTSPEAYTLALDDYFMHFLGRPADPQGTAALLAILDTGSSPLSIAALFLASPEYFQRVQIAPC